MSSTFQLASCILSLLTFTTYSWEEAEDVGAYFGGRQFCGMNRCVCFAEARSCCTPFGPLFGDTLTAGTLCGSCAACPNYFLEIEIPTDASNHTYDIAVNKYPSGYEHEQMNVSYTLHSYGQIMQSEFESLSEWTNYLNASAENNSPQSLFGNALGIEVLPMGTTHSSYNETLTIEAGFATNSITLEIYSNWTDITYEECSSTALGFGLFLTLCTTPETSVYNCTPIFPTVIWIQVLKGREWCSIFHPQPVPTDTTEDETPNRGLYIHSCVQNQLFAVGLLITCLFW